MSTLKILMLCFCQPFWKVDIEIRLPFCGVPSHDVGQRTLPAVHEDDNDFAANQSYGDEEPQVESTHEGKIESHKIGRCHDYPDNRVDSLE